MGKKYIGITVIVLAIIGALALHTPQAWSMKSLPTGPLPTTVEPLHCILDLTILPSDEIFSGTVTIILSVKEKTDHIWLHGKDLDVSSATLTDKDGNLVNGNYKQLSDSGVARIDLPRAIGPGKVSLEIVYRAAFVSFLEGLYRIHEAGEDYAFTLFSEISARLAFPGFDEPRFKLPFDIRITTDKDNTVITNTPETKFEKLSNGLVRHHFATTKPLPSYLLALAVGPFDIVETDPIPASAKRAVPLRLRGIAVKGKAEKLGYALDISADIVAYLERYFDLPYPYEKLDVVAVPEFVAGAMENAGAIMYDEQFILVDKNTPVDMKRYLGYNHAHELVHHWFGNLVTPRWWDDLWLNESFARWLAVKTMHDLAPSHDYQRNMLKWTLAAMNEDSKNSARRIRQAIKSNGDIVNAFDAITYGKGGAVLAMFENYLGEDKFRNSVRNYLQRFQHGNAQAADFLQALSDKANEPNIAEAFNSFLKQAGVPYLDVKTSCKANNLEITVSQSRYVPLGTPLDDNQHWTIPACFRSDLGEICQMLSKPVQALIFKGPCPQFIIPNAHGAGYYRWQLEQTQWTALLNNLDSLDASEVLTLLDNLSAGFGAGTLSAETLLRTYRRIANHKDWDVSIAPITTLRLIQRTLITDESLALFRAYATSLYDEHSTQLGIWPNTVSDTKNPMATTLKRKEIIDFVATVVYKPQLRAQLATLALSYVTAQNDPLKKDAINPDLIDTALKVAVDDIGSDFSAALLNKGLASNDAQFRRHVFQALASAEKTDGALVDRLLALLLRPELRLNEINGIAKTLAGNQVHRERLWLWLQENLSSLIERNGSYTAGHLIFLAEGFCDSKKRNEVETFFTPYLTEMGGGPRNLKQTLETIDQCIALKDTKTKEVATSLMRLAQDFN